MSAANIRNAFVDTNLWIYQIDRSEPNKRKIITQFLLELSETFRVVISTQVLNEFFVIATKKLGIDSRDAKILVQGLCEAEVVIVDSGHIDAAIDIGSLSRISHWDALMIAAASSAGCDIILSEDLGHGQKFRGIEIINPFKQTLESHRVRKKTSKSN